MTRKQAMDKIAEKILENISLGITNGKEVIINGLIGLVESSNTELEEQYQDLYNKQIKITK